MAGIRQASISSAEKRHNHALDGLRFFAFLMVFFFHALQWSRWGNLPFIRFGYLGVPIFFVLSGFLIGGILLDLKDKKEPGFGLGAKLKTFYARRALRIFPIYYLFIGILAVLMGLSGRSDPVAKDSFFWHLSYLTNFRSFAVGMDRIREGHFWSLAVEEHFYMLAPLVVLLVKPRTLVRLLASVIVGVALARMAIYRSGSARDFWVLSPMQFDLLGLGIATAIIERKGKFLGVGARGLRVIGIVGALFFVAFIAQFYRPLRGYGVYFATFGPISLGLATAAMVLTLWQRPAWLPSRFLSLRPFAYLGQISYGLYLFHPNCLGWSASHYGTFNLKNAAAGLAITIGVAMLSWHLFEKPINDLKRYFVYVGKPKVARQPSADSAAAKSFALPET
jgi:peptidoglycan/LPS O-acetylase OafA/YrhL